MPHREKGSPLGHPAAVGAAVVVLAAVAAFVVEPEGSKPAAAKPATAAGQGAQPRPGEVPDVRKGTHGDAVAQLKRAGATIINTTSAVRDPKVQRMPKTDIDDWRVCFQSPSPGAKVGDRFEIRLYAVPEGYDCPRRNEG
ncbi:hypothetical protein G5C51_17700 [Streptomyces sp. A7024]|uniref:PASTA domain-containing protein n=1 Tax=Streptomyces coryli TaxID=1128680 RepID=A0A6G4U357_9ACTN|nr:PASTA domain-containing protein [Streptomyces coryli]NGN65727.1 hypothetical protein [Streptomyces coryli]